MTFSLTLPRTVRSHRRRWRAATPLPPAAPAGVVVCEVGGLQPAAAVHAAIARCVESGAAIELIAVLSRTADGTRPHSPEEATELQALKVREAQSALIGAIRVAREAGVPFTVTQRCCRAAA